MRKLIELSKERFQFYDSPIKRIFTFYMTDCGEYGFNSMIVRLKVPGMWALIPTGIRGFNSMIVRLKGALPLLNLMFVRRMVSIL